MDDNPALRLSRFLKSMVRPAPLQTAEAFSALYARAHLPVFRYTYGLCGARAEAEDLTAETFARAWKARERFSGDDSAALGWLLQIARRLVIDAHRRETVRGPQEALNELIVAAGEASPEELALQAEQKRVLWGLLQTLPLEQREMLVLRYLLGWRVTQIADLMGLNENTVSVAIRRSLTRLARSWPSPDSPEGVHHD